MHFNYRRKLVCTAFILLFFISGIFTVSADFNTTVDSILAEEKISYGSASFALLVGTGVLSEGVTVQEAAEKMAADYPDTEMEWDRAVTLDQFSYMIMTAYNMKGGLMYRLFPGPRYAVRELRHKKILQGISYSTMSLSGERAFRIIGRVLEMEEAENDA